MSPSCHFLVKSIVLSYTSVFSHTVNTNILSHPQSAELRMSLCLYARLRPSRSCVLKCAASQEETNLQRCDCNRNVYALAEDQSVLPDQDQGLS